MASIRSFKELRVWQNAMDAAMCVFELTKKFPPEEKYSLVDQFRRASRSVASNTAEAWRKRRYPAAFVAKLNDAEAEAAEAQTCTEVALRCRYMSAVDARRLDGAYEEILGQLVKMIQNAEDWTIDPGAASRSRKKGRSEDKGEDARSRDR